jgi:hypothetical protein
MPPGNRIGGVNSKIPVMPAENENLIDQQLNALTNLYEYHLDLFWKWISKLYRTRSRIILICSIPA